MRQLINDLFARYGDNRLAIAVVGVFLGAILTKLLPFFLAGLSRAVRWLGHRLGGRFAYSAFEKRYLDWLVVELRELRLTGIVSFDDSKKPRLEQVFVSLSVGEQRDESSTLPSALLEEFLAAHRHKRTWRDLVKLLRAPTGGSDANEIRVALLGRLGSPAVTRTLTQRGSFDRLARLRYAYRANLKPRVRRLIRRPGLGSELADSKRLVTELERIVVDWAIDSGLRADGLETIQLKRLLRENQRMAVLGPPGSGKSTLLQYVGLTHARYRCSDRKLRNRRLLKTRLGASGWRLPLFIPLASVASALIKRPGERLDPSLVDAYPGLLPPDLQSERVCRDFFAARLEKGRCVVLIDGLDEVPTETEFQASTRAIESLALRYPHNRFIVTSRIAGWRSGLTADFPIYYVRDLTDRQVDSFINLWYAAVELNAVSGRLEDESHTERTARGRRAAQKAAALQQALRANISIRRLSANPMLLSIIALVHRGLAVLPRERQKLYGECAKILLEQWDMSRGVRVDDTGLKLEQKEAILRRIAYSLHSGQTADGEGTREAPRMAITQLLREVLPAFGRPADDADRLLQRLIERSGIITERRRDVLAFSHLTFQEYFAARHLASGDNALGSQYLLARERLYSEWWREVVLLNVGLVADASHFIRSVFAEPHHELWDERLRMAGMCLGEAAAIKDATLRDEIGVELLELRMGREARRDTPIASEVLGYLSDFAASSRWYPAAVLHALRRTEKLETQKELCDAIVRALADAAVPIREATTEGLMAAPRLLSVPEVANALGSLLADGDPRVREAAVRTLLGSTQPLPADVIDKLQRTLSDSEVDRDRVLVYLGQAGEGRAGTVVTRAFARSCLQSERWHVRRSIAELLPRIMKAEHEDLMTDALGLLADEDEYIREQATKSIASMAEIASLRRVMEGWIAARLNGQDSEGVIAALRLVAEGKDPSVGSAAEIAERLRDRSAAVREAAADAIVETGASTRSNEVRGLLLKMAASARKTDVRTAWRVLWQSGGLRDGEESIFSAAIDVAGRGSSSLAADGLRLVAASGALGEPFRAEIRELVGRIARSGKGDLRAAALEVAPGILDDAELAVALGASLGDGSVEVARVLIQVLNNRQDLLLPQEWTIGLLKGIERAVRLEGSFRRLLLEPVEMARRVVWRSRGRLRQRHAPEPDWPAVVARVTTDGIEDEALDLMLKIAAAGTARSAEMAAFAGAARLVKGSEPRFDRLMSGYLEGSFVTRIRAGDGLRFMRYFSRGGSQSIWEDDELHDAMWGTMWTGGSLYIQSDGSIVAVPFGSASGGRKRDPGPLAIALKSLAPAAGTRRLMELLDSSEETKRVVGLELVATEPELLPVAMSRPPILEALRDSVPYVRRYGLSAAGSLLEVVQDDQLLSAVRGLLGDGERHVAEHAWGIVAATVYHNVA